MQTFQSVLGLRWYKDTHAHTADYCTDARDVVAREHQVWQSHTAETRAGEENLRCTQNPSMVVINHVRVYPLLPSPHANGYWAAQALNFQVIFLHSRVIKWAGTKRKRQGKVTARRERMMKEDRKSVTNVSCWNIQPAAAWCVTRSRNDTYSTTASSHVHARSWRIISPLCAQNSPQKECMGASGHIWSCWTSCSCTFLTHNWLII